MFYAAIHSPIPALAKFGWLKGLVAHAIFPINTGKLEGLNNKKGVLMDTGIFYISFPISNSSPSLNRLLKNVKNQSILYVCWSAVLRSAAVRALLGQFLLIIGGNVVFDLVVCVDLLPTSDRHGQCLQIPDPPAYKFANHFDSEIIHICLGVFV